jgi:predicted alpha/beta hydrolase family esterase
MRYFSGFSLLNEEVLLKDYIDSGEYSVVGFSYGAIKAVEYAINCNIRVDTITLISPAFFQSHDEKFKRVQLLHYKKDKDKYIENFLQNVAYPSSIDLSEFSKDGKHEELEELLNYKWDIDMLSKLSSRSNIRVFLGKEDKIIDGDTSAKFWQSFADVYILNNKGHILR